MNEHFKVKGLQVLNGPFYDKSALPQRWSNESPLPYYRAHVMHFLASHFLLNKRTDWLDENRLDIQSLNPESFPLIEDFEVIMCSTILDDQRDDEKVIYEAVFWSASRGILSKLMRFTPLLDYTTEALSLKNFRIPLGDVNLPYFDAFESIHPSDYPSSFVMIVEWEQFVYIIATVETGFLTENGYKVWCKVARERYLSQWENAIHISKEYEEKWAHQETPFRAHIRMLKESYPEHYEKMKKGRPQDFLEEQK